MHKHTHTTRRCRSYETTYFDERLHHKQIPPITAALDDLAMW